MGTILSDKERIGLDEVFKSISYSNRDYSSVFAEIIFKKNYKKFIKNISKMAKIGKKVTQIDKIYTTFEKKKKNLS